MSGEGAIEAVGEKVEASLRPRITVLSGLLALVGCALGISSSAPREDALHAATPISAGIQKQIASMTTGAGQPIVVEGASAVERNALIPLSSLPAGKLSGFSEISFGDPGYANALKCMTQAIYYEAANEPEAGKRAVAQVVINRLRHPAYPNSVCGVVYQGANSRVCQFSFTCDGSLLRAPMARQWGESRRIAAAALAGSVEPEVGTATNYHADYVLPRWAFTMGKLAQVGRHIFYRLPGPIGSDRAFTDHWTGNEAIPTLDWGRLRMALSARDVASQPNTAPDNSLVPGLTVVPDSKDRHADSDVGGRLDTRTPWRLSIPDPAQISSSYHGALSGQGATVEIAQSTNDGGA